MTIYLGRALPRTSVRRCSCGRAVRLFRGVERSCFRWGLPEPASPRNSVSSYLTISPLLPAEAASGMFLWHFPSSFPDRTLSCTLPDEARTFLTLSGRGHQAYSPRPLYHARDPFVRVKSGGKETRTPDPHAASVMLYQLSYAPATRPYSRRQARLLRSRLPPPLVASVGFSPGETNMPGRLGM
jgi:hypothetical protein